jgi:predicted ester cyclase
MPEANKELVRRFMQAIDTGDPAILDQYVAEDYVDHNPPPHPDLPKGLPGSRRAFELGLIGFSEFHHEIEDQIAEGDKVVSVIRGWGKHTGEFLGVPASGREVTMYGISIHRIQDGKIVEHWAQIDAVGLLQQMGAIPGPGQPG